MLWLRVYSASQGLDSAGGVGGGTLFTASILFIPGPSGRVAAEIQAKTREGGGVALIVLRSPMGKQQN